VAPYVNVNINNFITLIQGTKRERLQATRQLFHLVDQVFWFNDTANRQRQEPNSVKHLTWGDAYWSTRKKRVDL